ncbi:DeoR/GlpR family DNA-binding transcription regulator [uncultured Cohaesibacter sp.]|uniref:DeoR/GlpR family DNA-binding transcription regulator n=1 Tax=uncultured Cohaesibacter sp. TaxID=1002546 RepID=UPI00292FD31E|nr:DeoR/GlpR family DNA-binding transcription regulator [uncultured Cohaesibacter sp.]
MLPSRLQAIVNRVDHLGSVSVADLSEQFGVAVETIRRDLRSLEEAGYLRRIHGGACSLLDNDEVLAFGSRQSENTDAKMKMAEHAVGLVREGDKLMLDPSSSCWYLARALPDMPLTVMTNSVRILFDLVQKPNIKVIGIGGRYFEKYGAFLGSITVSHILDFHADICFLSCAGYLPESGAWDSNDLNAGVKKAMLRSTRTHALLCDKSKVGRGGFILINESSLIHCRVDEDGVYGGLHRDA